MWKLSKAQLGRGLVAQLDEPNQVVGHDRADLLAGQPGLLSLGRIGLGLEDLLDLVVRDSLPVDRASERAEVLLDFGAQLDNLFEQVGLDLVGQVPVVEDRDLPSQKGVTELIRIPSTT